MEHPESRWCRIDDRTLGMTCALGSLSGGGEGGGGEGEEEEEEEEEGGGGIQCVVCQNFTRGNSFLSEKVALVTLFILYDHMCMYNVLMLQVPVAIQQTLLEYSGRFDNICSLELGLDERHIHDTVWSWLRHLGLHYGVGAGECPW